MSPPPRPPGPDRELSVPPGDAGRRLDRFLRIVLKEVPLSAIYRFIREGKVRLNGRKAEPAARLAAGDVLLLPAPARPAAARLASAGPPLRLPVLYEDEDLLALDKPAGMAVHPGAGQRGRTVVDFLEGLASPGGALSYRPSLVHRLDRWTSGILLVGKSPAAIRGLSEQFRGRRLAKTYLALCGGRPLPAAGRIAEPVEGAEALTVFRVRESLGPWTLVELDLATGRTHQLRLHLAGRGSPIAGDRRHGDAAANRRAAAELGLKRLFLHAARAILPHPVSGRELRLESPLPPDLERALARAREEQQQ